MSKKKVAKVAPAAETINPVGRPSKYKPEYCEQLLKHMSEGLSFESFAGVIEVSNKTLYAWAEQFPEFLHAKEIGTDKSRIFWESLGINHIINKSDSESTAGMGGSSKSRSLNASVWIFNMKNRFQWRDKQPGEADVVVNNLTTLSDEEIDARLEKLKGEK